MTEAKRRLRMVVANTRPDPTGRFLQFTPKILREAAQTGEVPLLLDFDYDKRLGAVIDFIYDEEREELIAEAILLPDTEIPKDFLPALGYAWDPKTKRFLGLTSVGLSLEPAKPDTRFIETDDST